jgi:cell wall-associated NlpC family hydrolase
MPRSHPRSRPRRLLLGALAAAVVPVGLGALAGRPAVAGSVASEQTQAAALAARIQAEGTRLDQLAGDYDAAVIAHDQIDAAVAGLGAKLAGTNRDVTTTRQVLREQALAAYMTGGQPVLEFVSGRAGRDPSITSAYAEIAAGDEQRTLSSLAVLLAAQTSERQALRTRQAAAAASVQALTSAEHQAREASAAETATLDEVRGRIAVLVDADERAEQAHQAALEISTLRREGERTPAATGGDERDGQSGGAPGAATAPPTTGTPTTQPSATEPSTAGPSTAGPPATQPAATHPSATEPSTSQPTVTQPTVTPPPVTQPTVTPPPVTEPAGPPPTEPATTAPPVTSPPVTSPPTTAPSGGPSPQAPGAAAALAYARAQLGKPYQWGGAGPKSFDCSGLTMMAWRQGGVSFPHLAQDQYDLTERIPLADLLPGDLVFFGTPDDVYHVGMYVGGGDMIDAPSTGNFVRIESMYWTDLLGGGRVT